MHCTARLLGKGVAYTIRGLSHFKALPGIPYPTLATEKNRMPSQLHNLEGYSTCLHSLDGHAYRPVNMLGFRVAIPVVTCNNSRTVLRKQLPRLLGLENVLRRCTVTVARDMC